MNDLNWIAAMEILSPAGLACLAFAIHLIHHKHQGQIHKNGKE